MLRSSIVSVESWSYATRESGSIDILLMAVVEALFHRSECLVFGCPPRIVSLVELTVSDRLSTISSGSITHPRLLEYSSDEVLVSPCSPHILEFFTAISVYGNCIIVSYIFYKFCFGSIPVLKWLFLWFWSPLTMSRNRINWKWVFHLEIPCENCHRFCLFLRWLVIS